MALQHEISKMRLKEVSTRLIRPTLPEIDVPLLMKYLKTWRQDYEMGECLVYDEGLAQKLLCDPESHHIFYAALVLSKPSLRCRVMTASEEDSDSSDNEDKRRPRDLLGEKFGNRLTLVGGGGTSEEAEAVKKLTDILEKKNYKFMVA